MEAAVAASIAELSTTQIAKFFQIQCDKEAERILDMPVGSTPVQGTSSYTVVSDDGTLVI